MEKQNRDLQELVFGDALSGTPEAELQAISNHPSRRDELTQLLRLRETLLSLREEEPPRRTVLVAPVSAARAGWWRSLLRTPGWGFAGACALAAAIVFHAVWVPAPVGDAPHTTAKMETLAVPASVDQSGATDATEARIEELVQARMGTAVAALRAEIAAAQKDETLRLVAATEDRLRAEHDQEMQGVREAVYFMKKQFGRQLVANVALASEMQ